MDRRVIVKSDPQTIAFVMKQRLKPYTSHKWKEKGTEILLLLLLLGTSFITFCYATFKNYLIILAILLMGWFIVLFMKWLIGIIKIFLFLIKYKKETTEFISKYKGYQFIHYDLYNDKLEYYGEESYIYNWSDFSGFIEEEGSFTLNMEEPARTVWIPKAAIVNEEDFEYFKNYAKERIRIN